MVDFIGGYRFDLEDRDALKANCLDASVLMSAVGDVEIPEVIDLRQVIHRRSQGREGSCQGHGLTFAQECVHYMKSGKFRRFSPDAAYYWSQAFDGISGDRGSTLNGGRRVAMEIGAVDESVMPYSDTYNPRSIPANAKTLADECKAASSILLPTYRNIVTHWAAGVGATWWGIRWGAREDKPGWVLRYRPGSGGHSIGIGGWGEYGKKMEFDSDGLPSWLWGVNSHTDDNETIRLEGWCRWHRDAIEAALEDQYTVTVGITDMEKITPRKIEWTGKGSINA